MRDPLDYIAEHYSTAAAVTAARLEVVERLREMAARHGHTLDEAQAYEAWAWERAADQLEAEIRKAGE